MTASSMMVWRNLLRMMSLIPVGRAAQVDMADGWRLLDRADYWPRFINLDSGARSNCCAVVVKGRGNQRRGVVCEDSEVKVMTELLWGRSGGEDVENDPTQD